MQNMVENMLYFL